MNTTLQRSTRFRCTQSPPHRFFRPQSHLIHTCVALYPPSQVVLITLSERGCLAWPQGMERPPGWVWGDAGPSPIALTFTLVTFITHVTHVTLQVCLVIRSDARPLGCTRDEYEAVVPSQVGVDRTDRHGSGTNPCTNFQPPTSNLQPPTSNLQLPTSNFQLPPRHRFSARASRMGYNVMQMDTDVMFFHDPYQVGPFTFHTGQAVRDRMMGSILLSSALSSCGTTSPAAPPPSPPPLQFLKAPPLSEYQFIIQRDGNGACKVGEKGTVTEHVTSVSGLTSDTQMCGSSSHSNHTSPHHMCLGWYYLQNVSPDGPVAWLISQVPDLFLRCERGMALH